MNRFNINIVNMYSASINLDKSNFSESSPACHKIDKEGITENQTEFVMNFVNHNVYDQF